MNINHIHEFPGSEELLLLVKLNLQNDKMHHVCHHIILHNQNLI